MVALAAVFVAAVWKVVAVVAAKMPFPKWVLVFGVALLAGGGYLLVAETISRRLGVSESRFFRFVRKMRALWWGLIGAVLLSLLTSAIWDAVTTRK